MAASAQAPVNAAVLAWARRGVGVPDVHAAKKAGVPVERLHEWERGESKPSIAQLRHLAELYKRPLAVFFFDEVPKDFSVMKSFRRLPDSEETKLSPPLAAQTRAALVRRVIAQRLKAASGEELPRFTLRADIGDAPATAAAKVREALGISLSEQFAWPDERAAYKKWRAAVERLGVLVFQVSRVRVEEMRGLSAFQQPLPIILINGSDSVRGRTFSLFHELGHLLLRHVHVCDVHDVSNWAGGDAEVWCNAFAANLLVPAAALTAEFRAPRGGPANDADWIETKRVADLFKVSHEVILRRLVSLGALTETAYSRARDYLQQLQPAKRKGRGGPAPDLKAVWALGTPFVETVLGALHQRRITLSEVSEYLDVKVKWVPRIRDRVLFGAGAADEEHADL
jgi:Zn-dependent peptidase ImmA (M78 family)/transcriptional regulator with XRE-family HTH domain